MNVPMEDKSPRIVSLLWVKESQLWFAWEMTPINGFIPTGPSSFQDREGQYWYAQYNMFKTDMKLIEHFQDGSEYYTTTYVGPSALLTH